jgi:hypothetical protein
MPTRARLSRHGCTKGDADGSTRLVVLWVVGALFFGANFAYRMYQSGDTDLGYLIAMALCAVIAVAIVAPKVFLGRRNPMDWSEEIQELHSGHEAARPQPSESPSQPGKPGNDRNAG